MLSDSTQSLRIRSASPSSEAVHLDAMSLRLSLAAVLLLASISYTCAWRKGRATFYGNEPWYWSIHHGSCGYGYQWPDQGTGWDIAALSDAHPDYRGSCGVCYEIRCDSKGIRDGYGDYINRKGACRNEGESVVVKITDTCPCEYPNNYYSNKRWCCGDMDHFDMSVWAFQKLADMSHGVIPVEYRQVDCSYAPSNEAVLSYSDMFPGEFPPTGEAGGRTDYNWDRYFPNGGYMNSKAGDGDDKVSVAEYLDRASTGRSSRSISSGTDDDNDDSLDDTPTISRTSRRSRKSDDGDNDDNSSRRSSSRSRSRATTQTIWATGR